METMNDAGKFAGHTPGPWRVEDWRYDGRTPPETVPVIQNDNDAVAEVYNLWRPDKDESDRAAERLANAALIAAAPALLAERDALRAALADCITEPGATCYRTDDPRVAHRRFNAINDIALAALKGGAS